MASITEGIIIKTTKTTIKIIAGITFLETIDLYTCFTENEQVRIIIKNKTGFMKSEKPEYKPSSVVRIINGR